MMHWDDEARGTTCGGLDVVGAYVCDRCGLRMLGPGTHECESSTWRLANSGRSVDAGAVRIRAEGTNAEVIANVMARIVRLPEIEREHARLLERLAELENRVRGAGGTVT
jgi:hypothetical protein